MYMIELAAFAICLIHAKHTLAPALLVFFADIERHTDVALT
jgi:hypothetical protein